MKIKKYKKVGKNKYKVILENEEELVLYEDIILKQELLLKREIEDIKQIEKDNNQYELYDKVISLISKRIRCEKEIRNYLKKYTNDLEEIENIIKKLYEDRLLNKELFMKSYLHDKMSFTNDGPLKIKKNLIDFGFNNFEIEDLLIEFNQDLQKEKIKKYIEKNLKSNKKSLYIFKQKMLLNLINLGYEKDDIIKLLDKVNIEEENLKEKEIEKIKKKYSKKYEGIDLDRIIKQKLYEKGFRE